MDRKQDTKKSGLLCSKWFVRGGLVSRAMQCVVGGHCCVRPALCGTIIDKIEASSVDLEVLL